MTAAAELLHRTAALLRQDPDTARVAGLGGEQDAPALAALLDLLATELVHLEPAIRLEVVDSCRITLGEDVRGLGHGAATSRPLPRREASERLPGATRSVCQRRPGGRRR